MFHLILTGLIAAASAVPHLDLELTGAELSKIYEQEQAKKILIKEETRRLDQPVRAGKRNLEWLQFINNNRTDKISFSSPATQRGIPMDTPKEYNEAIAYQQYLDVVAQMPAPMKKVIIDGAAFTKDPGVSIEDYKLWGDKIDKAYQIAIRWMMMEPYLGSMAQRRYQDVRGYHFIEKDPARDASLDSIHSMDSAKKSQWTGWLVSVCMNSNRDESTCNSEIQQAIQSKSAKAFYLRHRSNAQKNWDRFFKLPVRYPGVEWTPQQPDIARVPFEVQSTTAMRDFLKINLEDEWKWDSWKLKISFNSSAPAAVQVIWQPGITPHVPGLGSGQIYMDSNAPLTEWDVQWTIRHEFGHVLGFPDCYLEYYDRSRGVIVSYQMDVTDLMCSRQGKLKERHFTEMKRVYLR